MCILCTDPSCQNRFILTVHWINCVKLLCLTNRKFGNQLWQLWPVQEIYIFLRGHVSFLWDNLKRFSNYKKIQLFHRNFIGLIYWKADIKSKLLYDYQYKQADMEYVQCMYTEIYTMWTFAEFRVFFSQINFPFSNLSLDSCTKQFSILLGSLVIKYNIFYFLYGVPRIFLQLKELVH